MSKRLYRVCRGWVCLCNAVAGTFACCVTLLYSLMLMIPELTFQAERIDTAIVSLAKATIALSAIISIGHVWYIVRSFASHFRRRQQRSVAPTVAMLPTPETTRASSSTHTQQRRNRIVSRVKRWWLAHPAEITRARMLCEVGLQVFQANKTSRLVADAWINRAMALVIIANSWFAPVLHLCVRGWSPLDTKILRLAIDTALDVAYSIAIPVAIASPYVAAYEGIYAAFPIINYFMDAWYTNAVQELRQLFVTSWMDLASKGSSGCALLYRVYLLDNALATATQWKPQSQASASTGPSRTVKTLDVALLLAGLTVLVVYAHAEVNANRHHVAGCLLVMRPWGHSHSTCAVFEISCSDVVGRGYETMISSGLKQVDPPSIQVLIISHCPSLEIPPSIQLLSRLTMVKMYNCSLLRWDEDSALRGRYHPRLQTLYMVRSNLTRIPAGWLADDFPPMLWDIELAATDIATFPDEAITAWPRVLSVYLNHLPQLQQIPPSILQLPSLAFLSLADCAIRDIPDDTFAGEQLIQLALDENPLQRLPESLGSIVSLGLVTVTGTSISQVPTAWLTMQPIPRLWPMLIQAARTPLCTTLTGTSEWNGSYPGSYAITDWLVIDCVTSSSPLVYPLEAEDTWRSKTD